MNPNQALNFAVLAGEIMLSSGAETYRVEDTIKRILSNCNFEGSESFVTTTGIFASIKDDEAGIVTVVRRVRIKANNFEKIILVNNVSRSFQDGKIDIDKAIASLSEINVKPPYSDIIKTLATGMACFSFSFIFGGYLSDCINAFFTGFILQFFLLLLQKGNVTRVLINILGGGIIAIISLTLLNLGIGQNLDKVIIGSLMPLVPGIGITNAIRDILEGDYLSGTTRTVDALIVGVAIATGVGTVLKIWLYFFGGLVI